jgi:hypothetical protein
VSAHIATAVAVVAYRQGFARATEPADLLAFVKARMFEPHYVAYAAD